MSKKFLFVITDSLGYPLGDRKLSLDLLKEMGYDLNEDKKHLDMRIIGKTAFSITISDTRAQIVAHTHCEKTGASGREERYYFLCNLYRNYASMQEILKLFLEKAYEETKRNDLKIKDLKDSFYLFRDIKKVVGADKIPPAKEGVLDAACMYSDQKKPLHFKAEKIEKAIYFLINLDIKRKNLFYIIYALEVRVQEKPGAVNIFIDQDIRDIEPAGDYKKFLYESRTPPACEFMKVSEEYYFEKPGHKVKMKTLKKQIIDKDRRLIRLPSSFKVNWSHYANQLSLANELKNSNPKEAYQIYKELMNKTGPSLITSVLLGVIPGFLGFLGYGYFLIAFILISALLGFFFDDKRKIWQLLILGIVSIIISVVIIGILTITASLNVNGGFKYKTDPITFTIPYPTFGIFMGATWGLLLGSIVDDRKKVWQLALICGVGFGISSEIGVGFFMALCLAYGLASINPFVESLQFGFMGVFSGLFMGYAVFHAHEKLRYLAMLSNDGAKHCYSRLKELETKVQYDKEIRKKEEIPIAYTNSIGTKFTLIPAGEFMMGSEEFDWAKPVHRVKITKPFYLGVYPVTQQEWNAIMGNNSSSLRGDKLPVEMVSWNDVQDFIKKLNQEEGVNRYRLPTEAEWEYAVRAGTTTRYFFGDDESKLGDYAWYDANSGSKTHEVGQKKPNPWGLYDIYGNVWEWVQDKWHNNFNGAPTDGSSYDVGDGSSRVLRGGSWYYSAGYCRSAYRINLVPGDRRFVLGFRLVSSIPTPTPMATIILPY